MTDLKERGMLDSTLIVWMGEFGRTPKINGQKGRDHYPNAWSTVMVGGGIKGGQAVARRARAATTSKGKPCRSPTSWPPSSRPSASSRPSRTSPRRPAHRIADPSAKVIKEIVG